MTRLILISERNGVAFRLRREGKRWVQTIKGGGSATAGLHQREEWEAPVLKAQPDFTKISDPLLIKLFSVASLREQLRPLFTTEFNRSTRMLRLPDGSEAEFCLDRGKIIAGNVSVPLCEIELELKSGSPAALFHFALDLLRIVPFRLENVSKAERGYALASGCMSPPFKAQPVQLVAEMSVGEAFRTIIWNCLSHLHRNEAGMLEGGDIEYLHQMRVALRRQRSALSIFSKAFYKAAFTPMAQELKWLAGQFGPAGIGMYSSRKRWLRFAQPFPVIRVCWRYRKSASNFVAITMMMPMMRKSRHYTETMLKLGAWLSANPGLCSQMCRRRTI